MSHPTPKPAILLMGPTASGKTGLAIELVRRLPCDIVSVDSTMVYRGLDIGSAKPEAEVLARAPHRLIDIRDPASPYSAADFRRDALTEMADIDAAGRIPLLVGGTMLYFRALLHGLSKLPQADPAVRAQLALEGKRLGWAALHTQLGDIDPDSAARIHPNDPQRIQRALEVYRISGHTMSELFRIHVDQPFPWRPVKIVLAPEDRGWLHDCIASRFDQMLEQGLVNEVKNLYNRGDLSLEKPSMRAVGYRQVWEYLDAMRSYQDMRERAIIATRQLARRQLTWLRAEPAAEWFETKSPEMPNKVWKFVQATL